MKVTFFDGILTCVALVSLRQDLMGKDAYIEWCQRNWVSGSITIPLAIIVLLFITWKISAISGFKGREK